MTKRSAGEGEPPSWAVGTDFGSPPPPVVPVPAPKRAKKTGIRDHGSGGYQVPPDALPRTEPARAPDQFPRPYVGLPLAVSIAVVCLVIAAVVGWGAIVARQHDVRMRDHGVPVSAQVVEVETNRKGTSVVVSFVTRDGRTIVTRPASFANSAKAFVGQSRTLKYDPENPEVGPEDIRVAPDEWSAFVGLIIVAVLLAGLGTGFCLAAYLGRRDLARRPGGKAGRRPKRDAARRPKGKADRRRRAS
jgi:hypothetical protein